MTLLIAMICWLVLAIVTVFAVILAVTAVILAIPLFLAISGTIALPFTPWDQLLPSKDMDLMAVFYHYREPVLNGVVYWVDILFVGAVIFAYSRHPGRNIFILGVGILICLLIRSFFV